MQHAVLARPERALKYAIGDLVTRYVELPPVREVPLGLAVTLELALSPDQARRRELYRLLLSQRLETHPSIAPLLLSSLARDIRLLAPDVAVRLYEALMSARWTEPPDLNQPAKVIVWTFPAILKNGELRRRNRLGDFGDKRNWIRAFAAAVQSSPAADSEAVDQRLFERMGQAAFQSAQWVDLVYPPRDSTANYAAGESAEAVG